MFSMVEHLILSHILNPRVLFRNNVESRSPARSLVIILTEIYRPLRIFVFHYILEECLMKYVKSQKEMFPDCITEWVVAISE